MDPKRKKTKGINLTLDLDTRRELQDKTYPLKIRLTFTRGGKTTRQFVSTGYSFTENDWKYISSDKSQKETGSKLKALDKENYEDELNALLDKAVLTIKKMTVFTLDTFKQKMNDNADVTDLFSSFDNHIAELEEEGRISTASTYTTAKNSIQKYLRQKNGNRSKLPFSEVTPAFLKDYDRHLRDEGKSPTTISMNTRCVRKLFNDAKNLGLIHKEFYPFGPSRIGKYTPPNARNPKKALSLIDIRKIRNYEAVEGSPEQFARDIFTFSYFANGMNPADIFRLKYSNITDDSIQFKRKKTAENPKEITVIAELEPEMLEIIQRWGNPQDADNYIFDCLTPGLEPAKELAKIKQKTKYINTYLSRITKSLGIIPKVTTMFSRHSFATILKNSSSDISFISEKLGHASIKTTMNYLSQFEREAGKKEINKLR